MMAITMPISPARTPRRAVRGWLSHLSERMNSAAATRYESVPNQLLATSASAVGIAASKPACIRRLFTIGRLPAEHFQHAVGDPETADDVCHGGDDTHGAEHRDEGRVAGVCAFGHDLDGRDD